MRVVIVGASGAVGRTAVDALAARHDIITVGRASGDVQADISNPENIRALFREVGKVDAVVSAVGSAYFCPIHEMQPDEFQLGFQQKVQPQVNLVLLGLEYVNAGGSFTLTSGVSNRDPLRGGASAAAANGALDGFVVGAAVDMPRGIRINAVSPEALEVSRGKHPERFYGHVHVSNAAVGRAFSKSVEGVCTGQVLIVD